MESPFSIAENNKLTETDLEILARVQAGQDIKTIVDTACICSDDVIASFDRLRTILPVIRDRFLNEPQISAHLTAQAAARIDQTLQILTTALQADRLRAA